MKIDLKVPVTNLEGKPMKDGPGETAPDLMLGKYISHRISNMPAKELPVKLYDWALKLWRGEPLELDRDDVERFSSLMNVLDLPVFAAAQALAVVSEAKAKSENAKSAPATETKSDPAE